MGTEGRQFVLWAFSGEGVEEGRRGRRARKGEEGGLGDGEGEGEGELLVGRKRFGWRGRDDALG